jgi:FAD/FMN-containing dehydrogenase
MASTGASGTTTVKYGAMKQLVMSLTVVTPSGDVIVTSRRARKTSAGYDLTHLYVGSEGTLGVITELTLRVFGIPEAIAAATMQFATVRQAVDGVIEVIQLGIGVARIELLDSDAVMAVYAKALASNVPLELATLMITGFKTALVCAGTLLALKSTVPKAAVPDANAVPGNENEPDISPATEVFTLFTLCPTTADHSTLGSVRNAAL